MRHERSRPDGCSPEQAEEQTAANLRDRGAALVEYALFVMLVALACMTATTLLGDEVNKTLMAVNAGIDQTPTPTQPPPTSTPPTTKPCPKWKKC